MESSFAIEYCVVVYVVDRTYSMYMGSLCIYCVYKLIKLTKKSEKIIHVLSILLHLYIKFQCQISNNEGVVNKTKFLTDL
jgi:hypothetical protein